MSVRALGPAVVEVMWGRTRTHFCLKTAVHGEFSVLQAKPHERFLDWSGQEKFLSLTPRLKVDFILPLMSVQGSPHALSRQLPPSTYQGGRVILPGEALLVSVAHTAYMWLILHNQWTHEVTILGQLVLTGQEKMCWEQEADGTWDLLSAEQLKWRLGPLGHFVTRGCVHAITVLILWQK